MRCGFNLIVVFVVVFWGCTMQVFYDNQPITEIVYSFQDSSVPPDYHRSYTATLTPVKAHLVVDSYGRLINDVSEPLSQARFNELATHLEKLEIHSRLAASPQEPCVGGQASRLTVYSGSKILLEGDFKECNGQIQSNLAGDLNVFFKKIKDCFLHFEELLKKVA
jgi:hypothetical protein